MPGRRGFGGEGIFLMALTIELLHLYRKIAGILLRQAKERSHAAPRVRMRTDRP
jgi:hypothetical protein